MNRFFKFLNIDNEKLLYFFKEKAKSFYIYENLVENDICEEIQYKYKNNYIKYLYKFENHNKYYNRKIYLRSWEGNGQCAFVHINKHLVDPNHMRNYSML